MQPLLSHEELKMFTCHEWNKDGNENSFPNYEFPKADREVRLKSSLPFLYTKKINNQDLLCSTGSYIQYLAITIMEKKLKKNIYMCIYI